MVTDMASVALNPLERQLKRKQGWAGSGIFKFYDILSEHDGLVC